MLDPAPFDRLVARRAVPQAPQRLVDGAFADLRALQVQRDAGVVPRFNRRDRFEAGGELERLTFLDDDVADVGRVDRLDPALAQGLVDRPGDQAVRHVVKDLIAESLPDDLGRHLARAEAGNARRLAVIARYFVDLGVDDGAWNLDHEILLRLADVYEFSLH